MLSEVKQPSPLILKYSSEVVTKKNNPCGCCCEKNGSEALSEATSSAHAQSFF